MYSHTWTPDLAVVLGSKHAPRDDRVVHVYVGPDGSEEIAPEPAKLRVDVGEKGDALLVHLDPQDEWLADSWHETVAEALAEAERGFGVGSEEWSRA